MVFYYNFHNITIVDYRIQTINIIQILYFDLFKVLLNIVDSKLTLKMELKQVYNYE